LGSTSTTPTALSPPASTSRGGETTAGAAEAAEEVGGTTTTAAAASDHQRDAAITHARGTTTAAAVCGARAAAVEATGRRRALTSGTAATDTHREQRARHYRHGRRRSTAHATLVDLRPGPFATRRARGVNGDRDNAGGHSEELLAACIDERRGTGRRRIYREGLRSACPAGGRDRDRTAPNGCNWIEHDARGQRRRADHDDIRGRGVGAADVHHRGAGDEVGARQGDRHGRAPRTLIRRDAR